MKWNDLFALRLSELIVKNILSDRQIQPVEEEKSLTSCVTGVIDRNFQEEKNLDREVEEMMDILEGQGHSFERYKMRPLIKSKIAKKKGFIL